MATKKHDNGNPDTNGDSDESSGIQVSSPAFFDFAAATTEVLKFLQQRTGFDLWMLTRVEGDDWIVIQAEDAGYGIKTPTLLRWADSFCTHMMQGKGPQVAPDSNKVEAYATAPIGKQFAIGAYIGAPVMLATGSLFGTLCAIDPDPQPKAIEAELPLINLLTKMLSSLLYAELELNKQIRLTERAETEALNHPETGCYDPWTELYNLNGWWQLLDAEESRCAKYALPAWVFYIDTTPGPQRAKSTIPIDDRTLLIKTSQTLFKVTNPEDVIAQVDDHRFAILAVECNAEAAKTLLERLRSTFQSVNIPISVGYAMRHTEHGLRSAWKDAEQALNRAVKAKSGRDSASGS